MLQTRILTVDALKTRLELRMRTKNKVTIPQRASSNRLNEDIMAKTNVGMQYLKTLQAFIDRVSEDQTRAIMDAGQENEFATAVTFETGRKYDKVYIGKMDKHMNQIEPSKVRYFVERATGTIYGAKSDLAPNLKWFFSTIYDADQWDWSGSHGVPKDIDEETGTSKKAGVKVVGGYGGYKHYEPLSHGPVKRSA